MAPSWYHISDNSRQEYKCAKTPTECRYISNIFESGVYELREKNTYESTSLFWNFILKNEIVVKYIAVKKNIYKQ